VDVHKKIMDALEKITKPIDKTRQRWYDTQAVSKG
jgi:hypothetical protein